MHYFNANTSKDHLHTKSENVKFLSRGGWGNADVYATTENGIKLIVKDFASRNFIIKNILAPFMIWRTLRIAKRLQGIEGVPKACHRRGRYAYAYEYTEGITLRNAYKKKMQIPDVFFQMLENTVREIHSRGIAHTDLRNAGNIIITPEGKPVIIDFCSAISTHRMPRILNRLLYNIDLSGIYKHWQRINPSTLDEKRRKLLINMTRLRPFWIFNRWTVEKMKRRTTEILKNVNDTGGEKP